MSAPFDHIAPSYDSVFSRSAIGQLQRKQVWNYLEKIMPQLQGLDILELNCGTGEDAMLFGERGFNIIATDISGEMLKVTQQKIEQYSMQHRVSSRYLDLDNFNESVFDKKFDLIFSNFGGLNCISPEALKKLLNKLPSILSPGGRFIAVIMPRFCTWETLYFLAKFQFKKAVRRWTKKEVNTRLEGVSLNIWYYNTSDIEQWTQGQYAMMGMKPVGIALPPSYLEGFFVRRKRSLLFMNRIEEKLNHLKSLCNLSDHYLIDLKLR